MFRVTINDCASYRIDNFIMSYFKVSLDLFTDCWIEKASIIKGNYIDRSDEMKDEIYIELNKNLSLPTVLPKNKPRNNYLTTTILLKGWNLFVCYSEDKEQKIRFVEDIEFHRR